MRRQSFDVLVVGPTERDLLFVAKSGALAPGSTIEVKEVPVTLAGSGANVAVALARLGLRVGLVTAVGRDARGDEILRELAAEGVDTSLTARTALTDTGLTVTVLRDGGGDPPFVLRSRGSNDLVEVTEEVQKIFHTSHWLYLSALSGPWEHQVSLLLDALTKEPTSLAWHPGPAQISGKTEIMSQLLSRTNMLFVSEGDAEVLAGEGSGHEAVERLLRGRGVRNVVLLKKDGSAHALSERLHVSGQLAVPAVDPRGAVDAFCAGFLAGYVHGNSDTALALQWGLTNRASVAGTLTTQRGLLSRQVLEDRLRKTRVTVEKRAA